jgi:hypothetical protein
MYESLCEHLDDFHLYFFAFDSKCYQTLKELNLDKATIISLEEFEDPPLLAVKPMRSRVEYCWTCTPNTIRYSLDKYNLDCCTYLDADIYFFASPKVLLNELGEDSVIITEHRYSPRYKKVVVKFGKYCVQFVTFKNNPLGNEILNWWRDNCLEWCHARREDGKFGDQKYLDDWPERFEGVHVLQHLGGGVAPWNVQQYDIFRKDSKLFGEIMGAESRFEIIFYHFQDLKFYDNGQLDFGGYNLSESVKELIYKPYIKHLEEITRALPKIDKSIATHGEAKLEFKNWKILSRYIKHKLMSNILEKSEFIKS